MLYIHIHLYKCIYAYVYFFRVPEYFYEGPAYRCIDIDGTSQYHIDLQRKFDDHLVAYEVGGKITLAPLTSVSLSDSEAAKFGGDKRTIFFPVGGTGEALHQKYLIRITRTRTVSNECMPALSCFLALSISNKYLNHYLYLLG